MDILVVSMIWLLYIYMRLVPDKKRANKYEESLVGAHL
jgi:hypothetical protein